MAERKVKFFRACNSEGHPFGARFPAAGLLEQIQAMVSDGSAELSIGLGAKLVAKSLGESSQGHHHLVLYRVSADDLPMLYENGRFRPLAEVISATTDIAEPAHFGLFPRGVVAHLYNHHGPKHRQLATYLFEKTDLNVVFDPIAREDIVASIRGAGGVRLFNLRARVEDLGRFDDASLGGMRALGHDFPAADIEVILRAQTSDDRRRMGEVVAQLVTRLTQGGRRQFVEKAKVAMSDTDALSEGREVDIFEDPIVLTERVDTIPGQKRYLEEHSAINALEGAYQKVRERLG